MADRDGGKLGHATGRDREHPRGRETADADARLAETVADARHTAMVEAARREGEPTARVHVADLRATLAECDALRAEITRLRAEAEQADELLAEYAARTALADELVRLIQRIGVLEDGTAAERWQAIPLHGRVAECCGEYETTYLATEREG